MSLNFNHICQLRKERDDILVTLFEKGGYLLFRSKTLAPKFCILPTSLICLGMWNQKGTATAHHTGYKIRVPLNPNNFGSSKIILTAIFSWQWVIRLWSSGLWHWIICMLCLMFHASIFRVEVSGVRCGKITLAGEHMVVTHKYWKTEESVWTDRNNEYETMRQ
jgi:hypothetical protein